MPTKKETHTKNLQKGKQRGEAAGGKSGGPKVSPLPKSASARANAMREKYGPPKVSSNKFIVWHKLLTLGFCFSTL